DDINSISRRIAVSHFVEESEADSARFRGALRRHCHHQRPGRERPPNRRWGEGERSGGGVAHVPAALLRRSSARRRTPCDQLRRYTRRLTATQTCRGRKRRITPC